MNLESALSEIRNRFCSTKAAFEALELEKLLADVGSAQRADTSPLSDRAHALAGTSSMLGLDEIAAAARHLEQLAKRPADSAALEVAVSVLTACLRKAAQEPWQDARKHELGD